ncbi:MAG: helix-turn-helix domain-containing protein [Methanomassiliicoccales archaeon]
MEEGIHREQEMSRLMADAYAGRIMSATYGKAMSIQELSRVCEIPIAVAYRRVGKMEKIGLVKCVREEEAYRGKKVRYYMCAVDTLQLCFERGRFIVQVQPVADLDYIEKEKATS